MRITISPQHSREKEYVFKTILGDFLNFDFEFIVDENAKYHSIDAGNGSLLLLRNELFDCESYLEAKHIPIKVHSKKLSLLSENFDLWILYGEDEIEIKDKQIKVAFDIVGASFFMLSRMEEYLQNTKDQHDRFPASASIAVKEGFYQIPIVDIYARFINTCLNKLNPDIPIRKKIVSMMPSHDLDHLSKLNNLRSVAGAVKRGLFKSASIKHSSHYIKEYIIRKNPFDQIKSLIKLAESVNCIATFYFLVGGKSKFDTGHFDKYRKLAEKYKDEIVQAGHIIGLHPSYESGLDLNILKEEKQKLENWIDKEVVDSRQHYLRVKVPLTLKNLSEAGLKTDSSLGYSEFPGFRCGTSREFQVFDLDKKEMLNLKERPLIAMDTSFINEKEKSISEYFDEIQGIKNQIKENGGNWTFLIHNSNFFWLDEKEYFELWQSFYKI